ncbi:ABC transporter ATP-binding protein [Caloranaerobacter ferrireducens]|uniref:ABC transporter ATP-binding protein n=1 Tax=Caloranaerobacter ferrireducens TaxID=1323370 RepID=UPI00084D18CF|nr:ABC transporter ATP-binding protein [Caloranaerobacter ferrireducens]
MIIVRNLFKSYGVHEVLKGINFEVKEGEIYGFLGRNGAGKSTTMNILAGLLNYDAGEVEISGMDMKKYRNEIMRKIGYLPEEPRFYNYMNAREYLNFIGEICGYDKAIIKNRTEELLELVKLKDAAKRRIKGYSRGMRQRLGIAVAVYNHPKVLFLDEPASALDPEGRKDMLDIIKNLKEMNITVFISTHILNDVERVCDKIGILNEGKIALEAELDILMKKYILPVFDIQFEKSCIDLRNKLLSYKWISDVIVDENRMTVYVHDSNIAKRGLLKIIAETDCSVLSYSIRKNNLEDIFMRVVKKNEDFSSVS